MSNVKNVFRVDADAIPRNVLITGAGGQLGTEWRAMLDSLNHPYEAFGSSELDITNETQVMDLISKVRPDVIINAAAYTKVDLAEQETERAFAVNAEAVGHLARAAHAIGALLVHYSTDYVFSGTTEDRTRWPEGYPEEADTNPVNAYGASKLAGERALRESDAEWLCLRVSWLCGAYGNNFIKTVRRIASGSGEMRVVQDQVGSPTFTPDLVRKTLGLVASSSHSTSSSHGTSNPRGISNPRGTSNPRGIVHVSSEGETNWYEFACEIVRQSGIRATIQPIPTSEYPTPAPRPAFSLLNCDRLEGFGLHIVPWQEGLREVIRQLEKSNTTT